MGNEQDEGPAESPRRARRRGNLERLIAEAGGASQVARESGTPKSHFSALLNKKRGLGDELAEKLETLYNKPVGWFDQAPGLQPEEQALLDAYRNLDPAGRAVLLRAAGAMAPDERRSTLSAEERRLANEAFIPDRQPKAGRKVA